jgi:hypothetical protein
MQSIAASEEVIMARFRELEHELRQAVSRLADSEHRLSVIEAESTRFRNFEYTVAEALSRCAAVETRLAASERLVKSSYHMTNPALGITQDGIPRGDQEYSSNLPKESVDP